MNDELEALEFHIYSKLGQQAAMNSSLLCIDYHFLDFATLTLTEFNENSCITCAQSTSHSLHKSQWKEGQKNLSDMCRSKVIPRQLHED